MKRLLEWIRNKLGIRQPSKIMAEFWLSGEYDKERKNNEHRADT